jgi:hypothetical protein
MKAMAKILQLLLPLGSILGTGISYAYSGSFKIDTWRLSGEGETGVIEEDGRGPFLQQEHDGVISGSGDSLDGMSSWEMTFGGVSNDRGYSVQQTDNGGYVIAGDIGFVDIDVYLSYYKHG